MKSWKNVETALEQVQGNPPCTGNLGKYFLSGILAEIGDVSRFNDEKEIQKLSGMSW